MGQAQKLFDLPSHLGGHVALLVLEGLRKRVNERKGDGFRNLFYLIESALLVVAWA